MKVLHILYALRPSGMEKMLYDSAGFWQSYGVRCDILVNDDEDGPFADELRRKGYRIFRTPWRESRLHLADFYQLLKRERHDVVHIHPIRGYLGFALVARLAGVRVVCKTFHSIFHATDPCRYVWHFLQRKLLAAMRTISFSPGLSVQNHEWAYYKHKTHLIWNWVDEQAFSLISPSERNAARLSHSVPLGQWVVVSVGNCHCEGHMTVKNHQLILRAITLLEPSLQSRLLYLHVGQETAGFPERELAKGLGIADRVRFMGPCDRVHGVLSCAELFVMSSLREGLGNSTIEALLSGVPVLLTAVQGLQDFGSVIPHVNYSEVTPESMAGRLEALMRADPRELQARAEASAVIARQYFSVVGGCSKLLSYYQGTGCPEADQRRSAKAG